MIVAETVESIIFKVENEPTKARISAARSGIRLYALAAAARPTRCCFVERDQFGRFVGMCFRADDRDVNR